MWSCTFASLVIRHPKDPAKCALIEETFFDCLRSLLERLCSEDRLSKLTLSLFSKGLSPKPFAI